MLAGLLGRPNSVTPPKPSKGFAAHLESNPQLRPTAARRPCPPCPRPILPSLFTVPFARNALPHTPGRPALHPLSPSPQRASPAAKMGPPPHLQPQSPLTLHACPRSCRLESQPALSTGELQGCLSQPGLGSGPDTTAHQLGDSGRPPSPPCESPICEVKCEALPDRATTRMEQVWEATFSGQDHCTPTWTPPRRAPLLSTSLLSPLTFTPIQVEVTLTITFHQ